MSLGSRPSTSKRWGTGGTVWPSRPCRGQQYTERALCCVLSASSGSGWVQGARSYRTGSRRRRRRRSSRRGVPSERTERIRVPSCCGDAGQGHFLDGNLGPSDDRAARVGACQMLQGPVAETDGREFAVVDPRQRRLGVLRVGQPGPEDQGGFRVGVLERRFADGAAEVFVFDEQRPAGTHPDRRPGRFRVEFFPVAVGAVVGHLRRGVVAGGDPFEVAAIAG